MTPEEWQHNEANRWLASAAKDLHAASLLVVEEPSASVFHSQQCAEKSEKALLTLHNATFRKTHDLKELGMQCALVQPSLRPLLSDAANLTDYAVVFRYLDAPHEPDTAEARAALEAAQALYGAVIALVGQKERAEIQCDSCDAAADQDG